MWYVEMNGKRISDMYPTRQQAVTHAFEKGLVMAAGGKTWLATGVQIVNELREEGLDEPIQTTAGSNNRNRPGLRVTDVSAVRKSEA